MDVVVEKLIETKCKELGLQKGQGVEIYKSLMDFIRHVMAQGDFSNENTFKSVYIRDLGIFYPNKRLIKKLVEIFKQENEGI